MPITEARRRANNKWSKENMTILACKVRKTYAEQVKSKAAHDGTSVNAILSAAIDDFMGENSDFIRIVIPPGAGFTVEQVEAAAQACGQSVQEWIIDAIKDNL